MIIYKTWVTIGRDGEAMCWIQLIIHTKWFYDNLSAKQCK